MTSVRQPAPGKPTGRAAADNEPTEQVERDGRLRDVVRVGPSELPPPGYAREEELKRRNDELLERLAKLEEAMGIDNSAGPRVEISKFSISNEIASKFDMLRVTDPDPDFAYYWANEKAQHGIDVDSHRAVGYEVVCGDMRESMKCKDVRGYRVIGDVILMRTPLDNYLDLLWIDRQKREMRENSVMSTFKELGERWGRRGIRTYPELNEYQMSRMLRRSQARQIARQQFDAQLREGRVPGLAPGMK